jgi:hypothetical protein
MLVLCCDFAGCTKSKRGEWGMTSSVLELAVSQGIWCALFVSLFWYVLKDSRKRQDELQTILKEYRGVLDKFADMYKVDLCTVKKCGDEIKKDTVKILEEVRQI